MPVLFLKHLLRYLVCVEYKHAKLGTYAVNYREYTGIATATTPVGDAIDLTLQGTVCDVTPVGVAPNQVFGAAFIGNSSITGGTGRFTGQAGTGSFSEMVSDVNTPSAPATFTAVGSSGH